LAWQIAALSTALDWTGSKQRRKLPAGLCCDTATASMWTWPGTDRSEAGGEFLKKTAENNHVQMITNA
jgi:hypothetical protein